MISIVCRYTCDDCGLYRVPVEVRARGEEDVVAWMDNTAIPALVRDHEARSPHCTPLSFTEVMIPVPPGTEKIGGAVEN